MLEMVISGAQIGADIAGLRAAHACGIPTGGVMPKGFRTKEGPLDPETVALFGLHETETSDYPPRTAMNVNFADGTVRLGYDFNSRGERLTKKLCEKYGRPYFDVSLDYYDGWHVDDEGLLNWITLNKIHVLNVAGNAEKHIEIVVEQFLTEVFEAALHVTGIE